MIGTNRKKLLARIDNKCQKYLIALMIFLLLSVPQAFGADVLFVVGNSNLKKGDLAIKNHLEDRGMTVHIWEDKTVKSEDAFGRDLVILSESARSKNIGTKFRDVPVPVICSEPWIFDDLGMTGGTKRVDYGRKSRQKDLVVVNAGHPLAGSFSGVVRTNNNTFFMGWGVPGQHAIPIATLKNDPTKYAIFAYETGICTPVS